ncbi:hypothetical protein BDZ91DRAFT_713832 [Kalaharituber pfeilii]|nr:hypothetical protein BDZ91DRAFT_713832 [Kalaharituber pfeilii]
MSLSTRGWFKPSLYCWYNCRHWLVDISTVRALITEVNIQPLRVTILLIYF